MKKGLQLGFTLLVLFGVMTAAAFGPTPDVPWGAGSVVWGAEASVALPTSEGKESLEVKPNASESLIIQKQDSVTQREILNTIARAPRVATEYVTQVKSGKLYGNQASFTVATVALDAANPKVVGRGINGIWRNNPSIFNTKLTDSAQITATYRRALTDEYLDELAKAEPKRFEGKDLAAIKTEMAKLREMLQKTKNSAAKVGKYYRNDPQEPSFEANWLVENCAEIWAVRDAILQGAKIDNIVIRTLSIKDGKIKALCRNCTVTFVYIMKAMD